MEAPAQFQQVLKLLYWLRRDSWPVLADKVAQLEAPLAFHVILKAVLAKLEAVWQSHPYSSCQRRNRWSGSGALIHLSLQCDQRYRWTFLLIGLPPFVAGNDEFLPGPCNADIEQA
jgi:hypothetical protein